MFFAEHYYDLQDKNQNLNVHKEMKIRTPVSEFPAWIADSHMNKNAVLF